MTRSRNVSLNHDDHITLVGKRLGDVPDQVRSDVEWMEGVHGSARGGLPSVTEFPIPEVLYSTRIDFAAHPRGSKAMIDIHGANFRLKNCRPGAWLVSSYIGRKWVVYPCGGISWLPDEIQLPEALKVHSRGGVQ
jgi:hypothetical protein